MGVRIRFRMSASRIPVGLASDARFCAFVLHCMSGFVQVCTIHFRVLHPIGSVIDNLETHKLAR